MTTEQNKAISRRWREESDKGNWGVAEELVGPNFVMHMPGMPSLNAEGALQMLKVFYGAFPDARHIFEDFVAEGDKVALRFTFSGTHTGEFQGIPPTGKPVAMVHSNNCTSDLNDWVGLFGEAAAVLGVKVDPSALFEKLYRQALEGDADGGGLLAYNYLSGEHLTGLEAGRPLFVRTPEGRFTLANVMRTHLYASLGALKIGLDILFEREQVQIDQILGHGGFFKTKGVGQRFMAAAMGVPVTVMETAGEGGAWGIALLAAYMGRKADGQSLEDYLTNAVFAGQSGTTLAPDPDDVAGFTTFMARYKAGLSIERAAVGALA